MCAKFDHGVTAHRDVSPRPQGFLQVWKTGKREAVAVLITMALGTIIATTAAIANKFLNP